MDKTSDARIFTNDNCKGCNRCIAACTVPEANIAVSENNENKIYIDPKHCINCGKCITACPHDARDYIDDTEDFLDFLASGEDIAILVAPSIRTNIPDWEKLLGFFKQKGSSLVYDTSFGADITTWAYIRYLNSTENSGMISQPCPAVVNYIEKHDPYLLEALMPVHSPALCAGIYMRKYAGFKGKIAFLSPCIAKKDEFTDPNTDNAIQYNVTFNKLLPALKARNIDYRVAPTCDFDNLPHKLGAIYPVPGGLKQNVNAVIPGAWVYQVEGQPEVKHFLDEYPPVFKDIRRRPFMVDILNCEKGCNLGTGAVCSGIAALDANRMMEEIKNNVTNNEKKPSKKEKSSVSVASKNLSKLDGILKLPDFIRKYSNKYVPPTQVSQGQLESAFIELKKGLEVDRKIDCGTCGYQTCEQMARAIATKINHRENCVEYSRSVLKESRMEMESLMLKHQKMSESLRENVSIIFDKLSESANKRTESIESVGNIDIDMAEMNEVSHELNNMMDQLNSKLQYYLQMGTQIVDISLTTSLLSMNASIQAAHAGEQGKGFAIIADEMKALSEKSGKSAQDIVKSNEQVFPIVDKIRDISKNLDNRSSLILEATSEILRAMEEINRYEQSITDVANNILGE